MLSLAVGFSFALIFPLAFGFALPALVHLQTVIQVTAHVIIMSRPFSSSLNIFSPKRGNISHTFSMLIEIISTDLSIQILR